LTSHTSNPLSAKINPNDSSGELNSHTTASWKENYRVKSTSLCISPQLWNSMRASFSPGTFLAQHQFESDFKLLLGHEGEYLIESTHWYNSNHTSEVRHHIFIQTLKTCLWIFSLIYCSINQ
jgi:hypothetical protein